MHAVWWPQERSAALQERYLQALQGVPEAAGGGGGPGAGAAAALPWRDGEEGGASAPGAGRGAAAGAPTNVSHASAPSLICFGGTLLGALGDGTLCCT